MRRRTPESAPELGAAIERTMHLAGLNLDQFASLVGRDARQVRRWMDGSERPQFDRLFAIPALRQPLVIALAEMAEQDVVIDTVITVRRRVA